MPMRNAGEFLAPAIKSILTQIEGDFAFLIIDDGSTDDSAEIAASLADRRTTIICDGRHLGVAARLNWALDNAQSRFVARMDADDIAAPHRLARQLAFMEAHPEVGICGSWYKAFETQKPPNEMRLPLHDEQLRAITLFSSPFAHPTVIFRLERLDAANLRYAQATFPAEDYDLWERARSKVAFANIPEFLHYHRLHPNQVSQLRYDQQRAAADGVRKRALLRLGVNLTDEEIALHCDYATDYKMDEIERLRAAQSWLRKLNRVGQQRNHQALVDECARRIRQVKKRIGCQSDGKLSSRMGRLRHLLADWR